MKAHITQKMNDMTSGSTEKNEERISFHNPKKSLASVSAVSIVLYLYYNTQIDFVQ